MKNLSRAERKLASALRSIRRMRRELPRALARGGKAREAMSARIEARKIQAARLRKDLERRRAAAA